MCGVCMYVDSVREVCGMRNVWEKCVVRRNSMGEVCG